MLTSILRNKGRISYYDKWDAGPGKRPVGHGRYDRDFIAYQGLETNIRQKRTREDNGQI